MANKTIAQRRESVRKLVIAGVFCALLVVMTVVPYTGYINIVPAAISITTLHIPVIIGAILLGWKYGAVLGGVWGLTCLVKAFAEPIPANVPFQNPVVSVLPRICVGLVAALVFGLLKEKWKWNTPLSAVISAVLASLTNTVLVLSALQAFGALGDSDLAALFGTIIKTLVAVNGLLELGAAAILTPIAYTVLSKIRKSN